MLLLRNVKYLVPKDRGFKELLLELMGPKPVESYSKYKTVQTSPNPNPQLIFPDHLARAGVAMSVWTAMDMGIPPQWMFPRVSFRAMLYLGFHSSTLFTQMSICLTSIQSVVHSLKVKSHATILNRLIHTKQTCLPKLFENLKGFPFKLFD